MSKSSAGNSEQSGKNVRAKSGLNKSILDQGWFEFRRQLDYKLAWKDGYLVAAPPHYTSQTCPCYAHVYQGNRQTQAQLRCVECGFSENADAVGAINVLRAGYARFACEVRCCQAVSSKPPEVRPALTADHGRNPLPSSLSGEVLRSRRRGRRGCQKIAHANVRLFLFCP